MNNRSKELAMNQKPIELSAEAEFAIATFKQSLDSLEFTRANFEELKGIALGLKRLEAGQRAFLAAQVKSAWGRMP
jgi:hypothetical protein